MIYYNKLHIKPDNFPALHVAESLAQFVRPSLRGSRSHVAVTDYRSRLIRSPVASRIAIYRSRYSRGDRGEETRTRTWPPGSIGAHNSAHSPCLCRTSSPRVGSPPCPSAPRFEPGCHLRGHSQSLAVAVGSGRWDCPALFSSLSLSISLSFFISPDPQCSGNYWLVGRTEKE